MKNKGNLFQVLDEEDLNEILTDQKDTLVVLLFSAKWCGPCRKIKPKFIEISKQYTDCYFIYINVDSYSDKNFNYMNDVSSVPYFLFYHQKNKYLLLLEVILIILLKYLKTLY